MADVDPKEILVRNKALVGAYVLALVPIGLYFPLVANGVKGAPNDPQSFMGKANTLGRSSRKATDFADRIENPTPDAMVYTERHVAALEEQGKLYAQELRALGELVRERDAKLERWFEDPKFSKLEPGEEAPTSFGAEFRTYWANVAIPKLVERYRAIVLPAGAPAERPYLYDREPGDNELRKSQKIYWIQEAILEAIQTATDPKQASDPATAPPPATLVGPPQFNELRGEEGSLYDVIEVRLELSCSFRHLPRLVRELLAREISMEVTKLEVRKAPFRIERPELGLLVDGMGETFTEDQYTATLPEGTKFLGEDKLESYIPEPHVRVGLTLAVFDFKPPPPPPAEEGEGEGDMMDEGALDDAGGESAGGD